MEEFVAMTVKCPQCGCATFSNADKLAAVFRKSVRCSNCGSIIQLSPLIMIPVWIMSILVCLGFTVTLIICKVILIAYTTVAVGIACLSSIALSTCVGVALVPLKVTTATAAL